MKRSNCVLFSSVDMEAAESAVCEETPEETLWFCLSAEECVCGRAWAEEWALWNAGPSLPFPRLLKNGKQTTARGLHMGYSVPTHTHILSYKHAVSIVMTM